MLFAVIILQPVLGAVFGNLDNVIVAARMQRGYAPENRLLLEERFNHQIDKIEFIPNEMKDAVRTRLQTANIIAEALTPLITGFTKYAEEAETVSRRRRQTRTVPPAYRKSIKAFRHTLDSSLDTLHRAYSKLPDQINVRSQRDFVTLKISLFAKSLDALVSSPTPKTLLEAYSTRTDMLNSVRHYLLQSYSYELGCFLAKGGHMTAESLMAWKGYSEALSKFYRLSTLAHYQLGVIRQKYFSCYEYNASQRDIAWLNSLETLAVVWCNNLADLQFHDGFTLTETSSPALKELSAMVGTMRAKREVLVQAFVSIEKSMPDYQLDTSEKPSNQLSKLLVKTTKRWRVAKCQYLQYLEEVTAAERELIELTIKEML